MYNNYLHTSYSLVLTSKVTQQIYANYSVFEKLHQDALPQKLHTFTVKLLSKSWSTVTTTKAGSDFLSLSQSCSFHHTSLNRLRCLMLYKLLFYRCKEAVNIPILYSSCMLMQNISFSIPRWMVNSAQQPIKAWDIYSIPVYGDNFLYFDDRRLHCNYYTCRVRNSAFD